MGTNFYVRYNVCECCDRSDELHVGKSSSGLRAYRQPMWSLENVTPIGEIYSWQDWKRFFAEVPHETWDEYGRQITDSEVIDWFEGLSAERRRRQYDAVQEIPSGLRASYWLDSEGFTMCSEDFS
jgi:hypothetical protein